MITEEFSHTSISQVSCHRQWLYLWGLHGVQELKLTSNLKNLLIIWPWLERGSQSFQHVKWLARSSKIPKTSAQTSSCPLRRAAAHPTTALFLICEGPASYRHIISTIILGVFRLCGLCTIYFLIFIFFSKNNSTDIKSISAWIYSAWKVGPSHTSTEVTKSCVSSN